MIKAVYRKLRGLVGVGLTWGALWAGVGAAVGVVIGMVDPGAWAWTNPILEWALGMGLYGAVSGAGFATLLSLRERSKTLRDLSLGRVAMWGVLGSAAVPVAFGLLGAFDAATTTADIIGAMLVTSLLGGTSAPASVAIARRAELQAGEEPGLLES